MYINLWYEAQNITPKLMVGIIKIQSCQSSKLVLESPQTAKCHVALVKHLWKSKKLIHASLLWHCGRMWRVRMGLHPWWLWPRLSRLACALTVGCQSIWCWPLTSPVPQELGTAMGGALDKFSAGGLLAHLWPFVCFKHCGCQADLINHLICWAICSMFLVTWYILIHLDTSWYILIHLDTSWYILIHTVFHMSIML